MRLQSAQKFVWYKDVLKYHRVVNDDDNIIKYVLQMITGRLI